MKKFTLPFHGNKPRERVHSRKQNIVYGILVAVILIFVTCWWGRALTNAYYNAFVAYTDDNASEIIESNSRLDVDAAVSEELKPLQEQYDSWRNRHLADRCDVVSQDGTKLHGLYYDCGFDRTVIVFPSYAVNSTGIFSMHHGMRHRDAMCCLRIRAPAETAKEPISVTACSSRLM